MKKKLMALLLVLSVVFSMVGNAFAAYYDDTAGHWAEDVIDRWSGVGIVSGVGNNKFDPDGFVTRGQAAAIFTRLLKLTEQADISGFSDVDASAWYADYIAKCCAAGIMSGVTATTMCPDDYLTREQMFTMFCRAMGIEGQAYSYKTFADSGIVASYAAPYVNALLNLGYISGKTATTVAPRDNMKRAEILKMIDNAIAAYVTEGGVVNVTKPGIILVVTSEATQIISNFEGSVVITQPGADVQVSGSFSGTIVVNAPGTNVSLEGLSGVVEVVANADDTTVTDAPVGTTVTSNDGAEDVVVNGTEVGVGDSVTVGAPVAPSTPSAPIVPPVKPSGCSHDEVARRSSQAPGSCYEEYCVSCGKVLKVVYCSDFTYTDPTCTEWGTRTCTVCNVTYTKDKAPLGHLDENDDNVCDRDPNHILCDDEDHIWDEGTVTTEPTCTEDGVMTYTCIACGETKEEAIAAGHVDEEHDDGLCDVCVKFYLGVSSKDTTISATVYDDYSAVIGGLVEGATVDASEVSATVIMQNVASLGADYKSHTISPSTGMNPTNTALSTWLSHCYDFNGATVNVDVDGKIAAYEFGAIDSATGTITATTDEAAARAAWQELTSHISVDSQPVDDSKIVIKNGSFIHIGNKVLHFETAGDLTLDNLGDMDNIQSVVRTSLKLSDTIENGVKFYAAAGTELAVGQSIATLDDPAAITVDGITLSDTILTQMQEADTTYALMSSLVNLVNSLVGQVDDAASAPTIKIEFEEAALPHICNVVTEDATCTTDGKTCCTVEGCTTDVVVIPAKGHNFAYGDTCLNAGCGMTKDEAMKFELTVTSNATVSATVYDDYAMEVVIPNDSVDASSVTITASMQNVDSLGVEGTRSHTLVVNTGTTGSPSLGSWLSNAFEAIDATINVNINGEQACVYEITSNEGEDAIIAAPTDIEDARDAWHTIVNSENFATGTQASDSYILIDNTSYVILDTEKLMFETGAEDLLLDNINGGNMGLSDTIRDSVKLVDSGKTDGVVLYIGAGTELAVGSSFVTLLNPIMIEIPDILVADNPYGADVLAALRDANGTYNMLTILVKTLNSMIGEVSTGTITVNITIG